MTSVVQQRWQTRKLIGEFKHQLIVRLRPGYMKRGYLSEFRIDTGSPIIPPLLWKGTNHDCWKGVWTPTGPWQELPHIVSAKWSRSFDLQTGGEKGTATATVIMDNVEFIEEEGIAGVYHAIERGYFSPERGVNVRTRPRLWPEDVANEWKDALNGGWQIEIWEGYGTDEEAALKTVIDPTTHSYAPDSGAVDRTYTGIVLDCDTEAHPDQITITAQDFSVFLTDQRLVGNNKAPELPSPVTCADRRRTQGEQRLTGPYRVSSGVVSDEGLWISGPNGSPSDVEWIEMTLPKGYYEDIFLAPEFDGMEMWISLYLNGTGTMDRTVPLPSGWVDLGLGTVPGAGEPWLRHVGTLAQSPARRWYLGHSFDIPDGSRLRLTFRKLTLINGNYFAGTQTFCVFRFGSDPNNPPAGTPGTNAKGWVLVEDAADVVRLMLIWAGFQEWRVEEFGWSLFQPRHYGGDKTLMDVIIDMLQQGSYIFYLGPPSNDDRSIGKPHFEHVAALDSPPQNMIEVRDTDMTETLQVKWDLSTLPFVIRYRGALATQAQGGKQLFGFGIEGLARRYMATYYPSWAGGWTRPLRQVGQAVWESELSLRRTAGIIRHFTESMGVTVTTQLKSNDECLFACVLAAIQYALGMVTGTFQVPGLSRQGLNDQIAVTGRASGVNSRMWMASLESEHVTGGGEQPGYWRMVIGGSLIDTQDMVALADDYSYAWQLNQRSKASYA